LSHKVIGSDKFLAVKSSCWKQVLPTKLASVMLPNAALNAALNAAPAFTSKSQHYQHYQHYQQEPVPPVG
jgi:hypothetical protein